MNESNFSEKESLELISQMVKQARNNMEVGSGNVFLYYGYSALVISVLVFTLVSFTASSAWAVLWFLMFVPGIVIKIKSGKEKPQVITYMDKAITQTWTVIGALFLLTAGAIFVFGWPVGVVPFVLMLPLSLLYAVIGTVITGVITDIKALVFLPFVAFIFAIYMLILLASGEESTPAWHLYFGISFILMMVIPGHIINKKATRPCSKI